MENVKTLIEKKKVIAIVRGVGHEKSMKVADALYEGGIRLMELTYNQSNPDSFVTTAEAIKEIGKKYEGKMYVGAGTVTTVELVELSYANGAKFIISPDSNLDVIRRTKELGMISMPGALTPTEVMSAHNAGADYVKLFPISALGTSYVKGLRAPISNVKMMAVGGVNEDNITEYLSVGLSGAGIGGNLANKKWIDAGEFHKITETAKKLVNAVEEFDKNISK